MTSSTTQLAPATRRRAATRLASGLSAARSRRSRADLLETAGIGVVVVTAALFLVDGGGLALVTGAAAARLVAFGRILGLEGTALLLIQLVLAARLPWIDRTYGHDRALVAHRRLSRVALPLLLAHALALIIGYAGQGGQSGPLGWVAEVFALLGGAVPDMLTAFVALAGIVLVAVTSVRAARARVSHERWHLVHLTAYVAIGLSLPHQLSTGTDIAGHPLARLFWLGLYVVSFGSIALFRVLVPIWVSFRHRLVVEQVVAEGAGVVSVVVTGRDLDRLPARAGQFFHWRFLHPGLWAGAHPWSLSAAPDGRRLRLTVRDLGDHSRLLTRLRPGTRVLVEGPYGAFTAERRTRRQVLLIAAGIGITPIRALAEELAFDDATGPGDLTVLYRARDEDSLVLHDELRALAKTGRLRLRYLLGPGAEGSWLPRWRNRRPDDADALTQLVPGLPEHDVYVCGPPAWMDLVRASLRRAGVPAGQVHDERFGW